MSDDHRPVLARLQHLMTLREEVETLSQAGDWVPAADWRDAGTHLELLLDVPGVDPASLHLSEEGGEIVLSGERGRPAGLLMQGRPSGPFTRTFSPPEDIVPQSGEAALLAGVLTVRFEKLHPTIDVDVAVADG